MNGREWLDRRVPPVPAAFRPWLDELLSDLASPAAAPDTEKLVEAAETALAQALSPFARERGGAFDLLAADAMATYAAEIALEGSEDPVKLLAPMVERLARADRTG